MQKVLGGWGATSPPTPGPLDTIPAWLTPVPRLKKQQGKLCPGHILPQLCSSVIWCLGILIPSKATSNWGLKALAFGAKAHQASSDGETILDDGSQSMGAGALSQKFHKSNSLSPATIRHLQDHFRNAALLGKWWAGCNPCHEVMEKLWTGPAGSAVHTAELEAAAEVLHCGGGEDRTPTVGTRKGSWSSREGVTPPGFPGTEADS